MKSTKVYHLVPQIPTLTAGGLGRLRIAIGSCFILLLSGAVPTALPQALHRNYSILADNWLVHRLASDGDTWRALLWLAFGASIAFTVGLWTRTAYAILAASLLVTRLAMLQSHGVHDWTAPMVIVIALLVVPWGDGLSADQLLAPASRRIAPDSSSERYGFAIWLPGLVMGLAFAAAAYSKLWESGPAWVWSGAVKYHFIEDAAAAPVRWGLWVAAHHPAAVAVSAGALIAETGLIFLALSRRPGIRLLAALLGLSLCFGFFAFQGVLWWPWVMWFSVFLPWDGWRVLPSVRPSVPHLSIAAAVVAAQLVSSIGRIEVEPLLSPYPMYAGTYSSPAEYEERRRRKYQRARVQIGDSLVDVEGDDGDQVLSASDKVNTGRELTVDELDVVQRLCRAAGDRAGALTVHTERITLDWTTPLVERRVTTGTVSVPCPPR